MQSVIATSSGVHWGGRRNGGAMDRYKFVAEPFIWKEPGLLRLKDGYTSMGHGFGISLVLATRQYTWKIWDNGEPRR
jgi:hypothetical protein